MSRIKKQILSKLKEYGSKMGTNTMGGDDYISGKRGGLRDNDGYDNVQYNKDMPMDEAITPPNSKKVEALKKAVQKINRKYKVQVSKIGPTKGEVEIELGDGNHPDRDYHTIEKLVKKLGIKHYSVFNESINEAIPQNFHQGRVSDYHTALRGKKKDYSGGTNFKKKSHGQPDIEEDDEDQETNHLSNKQTHIKSKLKVAESGKKKSDKNYKDWKSSRLRKEIARKIKALKNTNENTPNPSKSYILDKDSILKGTPEDKDAIDRDIDETVDKDDLKNAKFRLKKVLKYLDIEYKKTRRGEKYVQINYIPITRPQSQNPEFVNVRYEDEKDLQNIGKALKLKLKESVSEVAERDYKDEYKKFQSSTKSKKYRAELNKYNRDKGTYGNGDGKDASHKGGKIVGFESEKKNRGRAEKSRLKKND